jgi:hypothetical protein
MRRSIKIHFEDGNTITTSINGTEEKIRQYYEGQAFNFGDRDWGDPDRMVKAVRVEFLSQEGAL